MARLRQLSSANAQKPRAIANQFVSSPAFLSTAASRPAEIPAAVAADAFGAPPTPVLKQDIKQAMPPQADAGPKAPAPAAATAEAPAPVAEAPAAATATAQVPSPATTETAPSPTKPPAIKPVMPGGRKKSKNNKKKKKGNKKK